MARFAKVETQVDFPAQERAILRFWHERQTFAKLRAKNAGRPRWSFLDGPITANNVCELVLQHDVNTLLRP